MSALAGVFGPASASSPEVLQEMLGAMQSRASGRPDMSDAPGSRIVAARHDWEATIPGWSGPLIAEDEHWIVAADASLYYQADLRRNLGLKHRENSSGELLLLALRTWGARFARHVEGDYAIMAWERRRQRLLLARDTGGRRSLVYATSGQSIIAGSTPDAVVRHPDISRDYDRGYIAAATSFVFGPGEKTAYRQVAIVAPGMTLSFENAAVYEVDRWTPPVVGFEWERHPSEAAAEELRFLLTRATRERLDPSRPTTVTMSGGWDSPSVFASACVALEEAGVDRTKHPVLPVSMTYPPDDIGNEDDFINAIADRWSVPVTWLDTDRIPLLEDSDDRARKHDDPMMQTFEGQMRYLARSSRELGARVVLDGFGGDHIFHVSSAAVIADHLFFGRLGGLWQEWTEWHGTPRSFARLAILPLLSDGARDWIGTVRGRPMDGIALVFRQAVTVEVRAGECRERGLDLLTGRYGSVDRQAAECALLPVLDLWLEQERRSAQCQHDHERNDEQAGIEMPAPEGAVKRGAVHVSGLRSLLAMPVPVAALPPAR
jgi:asparagine synthetase B (glutamine-hydrolysing)